MDRKARHSFVWRAASRPGSRHASRGTVVAVVLWTLAGIGFPEGAHANPSAAAPQTDAGPVMGSGPVPARSTPAKAVPLQAPSTGGASGGAGITNVPLRPITTSYQAPKTATEQPSLRTANSRTIANPDGTLTVQVSQGRMNYRDPAGAWQPLDLSLVPNADSIFGLKVKANDNTVAFGTTTGDAGLVTMTAQDGTTISMRAVDQGAAAVAADHLAFAAAAGGPVASVYPTDIGFEFRATWADGSGAPYADFALDPHGLAVKLADNGQVDLFDAKGALAGVISGPAVYQGDPDVGGAPVDKSVVSVAIVPGAGRTGETVLRYQLNPTWLTDPARVFPVVLDPTTYCLGQGCTGSGSFASGNFDDFVDSGLPDTYPTGWPVFRVGYDVRSDDGYVFNTMRGLVFFKDVSLPDGAVVTSATLDTNVGSLYGNGSSQTVTAYRVTDGDGWSPTETWHKFGTGTGTGGNGNGYTTTGGVSTAVPNAAQDDQQWTVTSIVQSWYTRRGPDWAGDLGFALKMDSEGSSYGEVEYSNYQNATLSKRPSLSITFDSPHVGIDYAPELGPTYSPSQMIAGQTINLPIVVTNNGSGFTFDTTNWKVGYRFFDKNGAVVGTPGSHALPVGGVTSGGNSGTIGLSVTAPTTPDQYTMRLDLIRTNLASGDEYASDWAQPSLYYSRNKKLLSSDNTRWVGTSVIERDEASINVVPVGGTGGETESVSTGDGGSVGVNLYSGNLTYSGAGGVGFSEQVPMNLTYGYDSALALSDCSGILAACGWFTNYDERFIPTAQDEYSYQSPAGSRSKVTTDGDGQLLGGGGVLLSRPRITIWDEAGLVTGHTYLVPASGEPFSTAYSGANVLKVPSNTSSGVTPSGFQYIDLNNYRVARFAVRTTSAASAGIDFLIHNVTTNTDRWFIYTVGTNWTTGFDQVALGLGGQASLSAGWNKYNVSLWDDVKGNANFGSSTDTYQIKSVQVQSSSGSNTGSTYVDAWRMDPYDWDQILTESNPTWTSNSTGTGRVSSDKAVGSYSVEIPSHPLTTSPDCLASSGCVAALDLGANTFATWYWKKLGGTTAALTIHVKDTSGRTLPCPTSCDLTYYAGPAAPVGAGTAIQISDTAPADWTKVTRNVLRDSQQALGLYNDANSVPNPSLPPSQGPTPDPVQWIGYRPSGVDGTYLLIDDLRLDSLPPDWAEYAHPTFAGDTTFTYDFSAKYPDGSTHYFNQDGVLERITDRDGNAVNLDWTITRNVAGQAAYGLTTIHSPTDGTSSSGATYRRQIGVTSVGSNPNPIVVTFTEQLGTTTTNVTGRSTAFTVQTAAGTGYGIKDITSIKPARTPSCAGSGATGCDLFTYTDSTNHRLTTLYDPRSTGSDTNYLGVTWTSGLPTTVFDASHASTAQLNVVSWNVSGTLGPASTRVLWQNADDLRTNDAEYLDLTADGSSLYSYIPLACGATCAANPPTAPTVAQIATSHQFDGLANINSTITFRCPGVAVTGTGCTGTTAQRIVTRTASKAAAKVDNYADPLTAGELAWSQSGDQFLASLRDTGGLNPDLYRTSYTYNAAGQVATTTQPVYNAKPDYYDAVKSTTRSGSSLVAYWRLGETVGTSAADSSGNGLSGTYTGGYTLAGSGALIGDADASVALSGTTGYVSLGAPSALKLASFTIGAWFKTTSSATMRIYRWRGYGAYLGLANGALGGGYYDSAANLYQVISPARYDDGAWHYVVLDHTASTVDLYVDGVLVGSTGATAAPYYDPAGAAAIGRDGSSSSSYFAGSIDEVAIWNQALNANQIQDQYLAGHSTTTRTAETLYDSEGHPTQTDDQALASPGFESGLGNWDVAGGSLVTTDPANPVLTYIRSGYAAYSTGLTGNAQQDVSLVPGQTMRFQLWAKTTGTARPVITAVYWQRSTHAWVAFPSLPVTEPSNGSFTAYAWDLTLPADTDGRVRITLGVTGGAGSDSVYYDDAALLTAYARSVFDASGKPTDSYTFATGSTAEIRTSLVYGDDTGASIPANAHPGLWPTKVFANYIDGVEGPGRDQDVETDRTFDGWGRTLTTTDPDGVVATSVYDASNLTDLVTTKDNLNAPTTMTYDLVGNLLSTTTPTGRVTSSTYDLANHVLTSTAPDGTVSRTDYNAWGERTASWANYTTGTSGADHDLVAVYAYDLLGHLTETDVDCTATAGVITLPCTGGLDARTAMTSDLLGTPVTATTYPGSGGGGTARTTTSYFETYSPTTGSWNGLTVTRQSPAGSALPISPTGSPAPVCPGTVSTYCSSAAVWTVAGSTVSGVDPHGRIVAATDAYGVTTATFADLDGRTVQTIAGYVAGATPDADTNVAATTVYDIAGRPVSSFDALGRHDDRTYDAVGRLLAVAHVGTDGVTTQTTTTTYWPSGRVDTTSDGASTTQTEYDGDGRAFQTMAHVDATGAGMAIEAFEGPLTSAWQSAASGTFTTNAAAGMSTDVSAADPTAAGSEYTAVPPVSGRGRLHVTTSASSGTDGAWWDLSGPATFKSGHVYTVAFDARTSAGVSLRAFLGRDAAGGNNAELSGGITGDGSWHRYVFAWTPSTDVTTTDVHFAVRRDASGTAEVYLDNVVFWDATAGWADKNIAKSQSAYDADGAIVASILPPGDPATDRPLVTTTAADPAGRTVMTVVNDVSGGYAAAIRATSNLAAYFPLDERKGLLAADQSGLAGTALIDSGMPDWAVAGALDEARTAIRFNGTNGFLSRSSAATSATGNVSLEAWIRSDTTPSDGQTHVIAANGTGADGWGLAIDSSGNAAGWVAKSSNPGSGFFTIASSTKVTDGAWHHLVLERTSTTWTLYVDKATPSLSNGTKDPGTPGAGFSIGALPDGTKPFVGDVDDVSVYTANIGATATTHFDAGRRPTTDTNTALATRTGYDGLGRPVDTWSPAMATISGGVKAPTRSHADLDRLGHQTETWLGYQVGGSTTATGDVNVKSTFAYDVLGELTGYCPARQVYSPGCDPTSGTDTHAWHYAFDAMGRQTTTTPPVNQTNTALTTTEQVYDTGGHLTSTCRYPAGSACAATNSRHVDFTYDALGRVLTGKTYDRAAGSDTLKFTKTLTWNADGSQASVNEGSQTFNWVYDTAGRLNQFKDGSTVKTAYTYNATTGTVATRTDGTMGTTSFDYDWANREKLITPPTSYTTSTVTRTYRLDGTLATQAFSGSVTESLSYDAVKRPTGISLNTSGTASTISQTYDRGARVTAEGRSLTGISGDPGTGTQAFSYDGLGRVTGSTGLSKSFTYTYDLDSDRLTRVDGSVSTTFTYDWTDQIVSQTISGMTKTYAYDRYGNNTTAWDATSQSITYAYDEASRLTGITPQTGSAATLTVDALDRSKTRTVGANTDTYGFLGTSKTAYETGAGTTDALLDLDGSRLAVKTAGTVSWVVFDLHGSVVALCPAGSTTLSDAYRYDAWGQAMTSGATTNPWRYRGLLDVSPNGTSVIMMGARYFAPHLGSFTQEDTVRGAAADPLSMNRYLYAEADPATLIDPDGHGVDCGLGEVCTAEDRRADLARLSTWQQTQQKAYAVAHPAPGVRPPAVRDGSWWDQHAGLWPTDGQIQAELRAIEYAQCHGDRGCLERLHGWAPVPGPDHPQDVRVPDWVPLYGGCRALQLGQGLGLVVVGGVFEIGSVAAEVASGGIGTPLVAAVVVAGAADIFTGTVMTVEACAS
jgi:RHS repeat-associated protein